jgi:hypothetical protein
LEATAPMSYSPNVPSNSMAPRRLLWPAGPRAGGREGGRATSFEPARLVHLPHKAAGVRPSASGEPNQTETLPGLGFNKMYWYVIRQAQPVLGHPVIAAKAKIDQLDVRESP